jgi:hypothetical protein
MNIPLTARLALGAGLLGGTALLLTACGDDPASDAGDGTPQRPAGTSGTAPSGSSSGSRPSGSDDSGGVSDDSDPGTDTSRYVCLRRDYEIPAYTVGTARSLSANWGGGTVELSVHDAEAGWKYVSARSCGPSDEARAHLDDFDAAMRRTIADIR